MAARTFNDNGRNTNGNRRRVCGDKGKKGKHAKGKKGKDKGKRKYKGKHESSPMFEGYCGHSGKWEHKQKDCRYENTVVEVDEGGICRTSKQQCEQQHDPESHHHLLVCL